MGPGRPAAAGLEQPGGAGFAPAGCRGSTTSRIWSPSANTCRCGACCRSGMAAGGMDFSAGPGPVTLAPPGLPPFSAADLLRGDLSRRRHGPEPRPDWLVNITNDAWFGECAGPCQHLAAARCARSRKACRWPGGADTASPRSSMRVAALGFCRLGRPGHCWMRPLPGATPVLPSGRSVHAMLGRAALQLLARGHNHRSTYPGRMIERNRLDATCSRNAVSTDSLNAYT